ncbi:MAG TPA: amidohydrolase [Dehalococcoidia bacterium]|nr:amidohydrolase [Dehalococcoidia bacterium]
MTTPPLTVFLARRIVTMEPGLPEATAVAVRDGQIVAVGSKETLEPWLEASPYEVDDRFADAVLLPGLIDPHLHPSMGAFLLNYEIAAPEEWRLPDKTIAAVQTRDEMLGRLNDLGARAEGEDPLIIWGWNPYWHGPITRDDLDRASDQVPIVLYHRSFHEVVLNTPGLAWLDADEQELRQQADQIDLTNGHFFEGGLAVAQRRLAPYLAAPERLHDGLRLVIDLVHRGGVTTAADMLAGGILGMTREWEAFREVLDRDAVPFRTLLVPGARNWQRQHGADLERLIALRAESTHRLRWLKAVKTYGDGAFISQRMCLCAPGYLDGHQGEWLTPPDELEALIEPYWRAGFDIYHHVNGDEGLDATLDVLDALLAKHPRFDYRFNLEHFGVSREDQVRRLAALGATVSANGYYARLFADRWSEVGLGPERASQMTRLGSLERWGVNFSLHSDLPMGPVEPLLAVQTAVTRESTSGRIHGPEQRVSLDRALRAVTIDAAWSLRMDREIGSIAAGKSADFTVLDADPFEVAPSEIGALPIRATVFEGGVFPVPG